MDTREIKNSDVYTLKETARLTGYSEATIRLKVMTGAIKKLNVKKFTHLRFSGRDIKKFLNI